MGHNSPNEVAFGDFPLAVKYAVFYCDRNLNCCIEALAMEVRGVESVIAN